MERYNDLTLADKLKPIRATVLLVEEFFAVGELPCLASFAFRRIRAVEVGDMLVAYVAEPIASNLLVSVYLVGRRGRDKKRTSGFYSCLRIIPMQSNVRVRLPISHKRTRQRDPNAQNNLHKFCLSKNPYLRFQNYSRSGRSSIHWPFDYVPASVSCLPAIFLRCSCAHILGGQPETSSSPARGFGCFLGRRTSLW